MRRVYLYGARLASRWWSLTIVLWLVNSLFGIFFALVSGYWLAQALDGSRATFTLLKDLDPNVFIDLYYHHGESFRMLLVLALLMAVAYLALWCWFYGVVILALRGGGAGARRGVWMQGLESAPLFARLLLIAAAVLTLFSGAIGAGAWLLIRWTLASPSAMISSYIVAGAAVLWGIGLVFLVAVHDHARIRARVTGQGAVAAYAWALAFVLHGGERAFLLALALQATAVALWLGYHGIGAFFPLTASLGVTESLLWGEAFLCARMWMRVWFFASQGELQSP